MRNLIDIVEAASMLPSKFTIEVGALTRGSVRKLLTRAAAARAEITFVEEKDMLESTFTIRGPKAMLQVIQQRLESLM